MAPAFAVYTCPTETSGWLGEGESITAGHYACEHRLGGPGANDHRALDSYTARFDTNRWVFTSNSQVTYCHQVGRFEQTDEMIEISVNYYVKGRLIIEASADGQDWTQVGTAEAVGRRQYKVPFPRQLQVWVRLRAEKDSEIQVDGYRYEATLPSAWKVARAIGSTYYFCVRYATPELTASVSGAGLRGIGDNTLDLTVQSVDCRRKVEAVLSFLQDGKELAHDQSELLLKPARTVPVTLKFHIQAAGRGTLRLMILESGSHRVLWQAEAAYQIPLLYDATGGQLLSAEDGLSVWWCEPERRVSRDRAAPTERGAAVRIEAAGNEYEAAQVVLAPHRSLENCRVTPGPLTGPNGASLPASEIELRWVEYVFTEQPSDALGASDEWPDPLPPMRQPLALPRNRNYPVWVTVHVPAGTPAGDYIGSLTLTADGISQRIPLQVHVWGFDLPKETHLRSGFGLSRDAIKTYHHLDTEDQVQQVWELYLRDFARHRVNPYSVGNDVAVQWDKARDDTVTPRLDFTAFDRDAHFALDELGFNSFVLGLQGVGGGTFYSRVPPKVAGMEAGTPEYEAALEAYLRALQAHLEEKGWLKKAYVYWFDEPSEKDTDFVSQGMERIGRAAPKLTRMLTTKPRPALYGDVDLWCLPTYELDPEVVKERQAAGEEVWWYLCTAAEGAVLRALPGSLRHRNAAVGMGNLEVWAGRAAGLGDHVLDLARGLSGHEFAEPVEGPDELDVLVRNRAVRETPVGKWRRALALPAAARCDERTAPLPGRARAFYSLGVTARRDRGLRVPVAAARGNHTREGRRRRPRDLSRGREAARGAGRGVRRADAICHFAGTHSRAAGEDRERDRGTTARADLAPGAVSK